MMESSAEEFKELGNKAFAAQNHDEAIRCYTEAIKLDSTNHIYYSNRSASYAGKKNWEDAITDAKKCISLCPSFVKGYYRLVTAQMEQGLLDAALSTVKQGLLVDPQNSQLMNQLRTIKSKQQQLHEKVMATSGTKSSTSNVVAAANAAMSAHAKDASVSREVADLQEQLRSTLRDYNVLNANMVKTEKELRMNEITLSELDKFPSDADVKMYRGIGKMFLLTSRRDVVKHLDDSIKTDGKSMVDMKQKRDYLERRMKSQQQNIQELTDGSNAPIFHKDRVVTAE